MEKYTKILILILLAISILACKKESPKVETNSPIIPKGTVNIYVEQNCNGGTYHASNVSIVLTSSISTYTFNTNSEGNLIIDLEIQRFVANATGNVNFCTSNPPVNLIRTSTIQIIPIENSVISKTITLYK